MPRAKDDRLSAVIQAAATLPPEQFVNNHLLDDHAFVFGWAPEPYAAFRQSMEGVLGVGAGQLILIGSAKLGFSLNPDHLLRRFRSDSDLDLVVVSSDMFDEAVLELRQRALELAFAGDDERRRLRKSRENIFNGFLRPDQLPLGSSLMRAWFPLLAGPFDSEPARSHPVKAWLFKSWDHVRLCYTEHHERVQPVIKKRVGRKED